jgi:predicted phage-related endonuclease
MLVADLPLTHVAVLIGGSDFRVYPVARSATQINHIIKLTTEFMDQVRQVRYPQPDMNRDQGLLHYLFPEPVGAIEFDEAQTDTVARWERAATEIKLLESTQKGLKADLLMMMGDAAEANLTDGRVLKRSITEVAAATREIKAYSFPVLRIKGRKLDNNDA